MCQINNNFYTVNPGSTIIVMIQENLKFRIDCVPRETLYHLQLLTTIVFIFNFKPANFFHQNGEELELIIILSLCPFCHFSHVFYQD